MRTSSPSSKTAPGCTRSQSTPSRVRFSPMAPGVTGWPSAWRARICSSEKRQRARSGPPWCSRSRCASPSSPSGVTRAAATGSLGTPPGEILIWTTRPFTLTGDPPGSGRRGGPPDHALDHGLEDELAALVDHFVPIRDDTAVGLLRLALLRDDHADAERIAHEHGGHDLDLAAQIRHARAVDEARLHDEPFGEAEGEGAGSGAALEDRGGLHELHVVEERLVEAAQVDEGADVRLRHRAAPRLVRGAGVVLLVGQSVRSHLGSPESTLSPQGRGQGEGCGAEGWVARHASPR